VLACTRELPPAEASTLDKAGKEVTLIEFTDDGKRSGVALQP
jgi:hypothetical protein